MTALIYAGRNATPTGKCHPITMRASADITRWHPASGGSSARAPSARPGARALVGVRRMVGGTQRTDTCKTVAQLAHQRRSGTWSNCARGQSDGSTPWLARAGYRGFDELADRSGGLLASVSLTVRLSRGPPVAGCGMFHSSCGLHGAQRLQGRPAKPSDSSPSNTFH
jgi:hypothetical protein